jgi:prevent-host-death family protein
MKTITASEARTNLYKLIDETAVTSEPVQITGKRGDAVLISIDDWRAVQETLYLAPPADAARDCAGQPQSEDARPPAGGRGPHR